MPSEPPFYFLAVGIGLSVQVYFMWGGTFLAALLTLLVRNLPSGQGKGKDDGASESLLASPKPFSRPYSVVGCCPRPAPLYLQ